MKISFIFITLSFLILSQSARTLKIKAINKSSQKEVIIMINKDAQQVYETFVTDTLRAQVGQKEPAILRNFINKDDMLNRGIPESVYEIESTEIKPDNLWTATLFQAGKTYVVNLQQYPALRALNDKTEITIEIFDDGRLDFIPSCPCPPAIEVQAREKD